MIAYKVVAKKTRYGSNAIGYLRDYEHMFEWSMFRKVLKKYPELKQYFPVYKKNATVTAVSRSAGIFAFREKFQAETFIKEYFNGIRSKVEIIKIEGTSRNVKVINFIYGAFNICHLSEKKPRIPLRELMPGVVLFNTIKVLD